MSLIIYCKIGTLPSTYAWVKSKRKLPIEKEMIKVKDLYGNGKWQTVIVEKIDWRGDYIGTEKLYRLTKI